jgi:hypothetical protein
VGRQSLEVQQFISRGGAANDLNRGRWNAEDAAQEVDEGGVRFSLDGRSPQAYDEGTLALARERIPRRPGPNPDPQRGSGGGVVDV